MSHWTTEARALTHTADGKAKGQDVSGDTPAEVLKACKSPTSAIMHSHIRHHLLRKQSGTRDPVQRQASKVTADNKKDWKQPLHPKPRRSATNCEDTVKNNTTDVSHNSHYGKLEHILKHHAYHDVMDILKAYLFAKGGKAEKYTLNFTLVISAAAAKLLQLCPTLCDPTDGSPPGSALPGILQARILEWGAIAFSAGYL